MILTFLFSSELTRDYALSHNLVHVLNQELPEAPKFEKPVLFLSSPIIQICHAQSIVIHQ